MCLKRTFYTKLEVDSNNLRLINQKKNVNSNIINTQREMREIKLGVLI